MQQQGTMLMSVAHITTREYGEVPGQAATGDHVDIQRFCLTGSTYHWMQYSGDLAPSLIAALGRASLASCQTEQ